MAPENRDTHFYVHALGVDSRGRVSLFAPERVDLAAEPANAASRRTIVSPAGAAAFAEE